VRRRRGNVLQKEPDDVHDTGRGPSAPQAPPEADVLPTPVHPPPGDAARRPSRRAPLFRTDATQLRAGDVVTAGMDTTTMGADAARALTDRIRIALTATHWLIIEAFTGRAHNALGYDSWSEYVSAEFAEARMVRIDHEQRLTIVANMRDAGMPLRAIASAIGSSVGTVHRDLAGVPRGTPDRSTVTGEDGKTYPAQGQSWRQRARLAGFGHPSEAAELEVADAEIEPDAQPEKKAHRRPLSKNGGRPEFLKGTRRLDSNRIIDGIVRSAESPQSLLDEVDYSALDRDQLPEWIASLSTSITSLRSLRRELEKKLGADVLPS
jgi:hypothetical protein